MDNVKAAAESMAQLLTTQPAVQAAWLNYTAAQADRDAEIEMRLSDLSRNIATLRGSLDATVDTAVRRALEGTELRVMGLGALVDALNAQGALLSALSERMAAVETRVDVRTATLQEIAMRLERALPPPVDDARVVLAPDPREAEPDDPAGGMR